VIAAVKAYLEKAVYMPAELSAFEEEKSIEADAA